MKRLISTLNLSKEDWLRYRKCGITGTDAGAILGVNPYRSAFQVYCDKNSETIENIDNEAIARDAIWKIMSHNASPNQPV